MCAANGRIMQQEGGNPTDILDNLGKGGYAYSFLTICKKLSKLSRLLTHSQISYGAKQYSIANHLPVCSYK